MGANPGAHQWEYHRMEAVADVGPWCVHILTDTVVTASILVSDTKDIPATGQCVRDELCMVEKHMSKPTH